MKSLFMNKFLLSIIAFSSVFVSTSVTANSCSKTDIDYYLQKGFSHDQVVMLCSATNSAPVPTPVTRPAPIQSHNNAPNYTSAVPVANYQSSKLSQDQIFLSTALAAINVKITPQSLSYDTKECVEYGYPNNPDLSDTACVESRITIKLKDLKVLKVSSGLFLIKDAELLVQGNIQREYLNFNSIRRQEKPAITSLLPTTTSKVNIPVKRGIDSRQVADKIKSYSSL